jgi:hypothetical protein
MKKRIEMLKNKQVSQNNVKSIRNKVIVLTGIMAISRLFVGCDTETNLKLCTCTNKVHYDTPCGCDADAGKCDCTLITKPAISEIFNYNSISSSEVKDQIAAVYATLSTDYLVNLKNNYLHVPILIYAGDNDIMYQDTILYSDCEITVVGNPQNFTDKFEVALEEFKNDDFNKISVLGRKFNDAKNTVRLSMGRTVLPQKQA